MSKKGTLTKLRIDLELEKALKAEYNKAGFSSLPDYRIFILNNRQEIPIIKQMIKDYKGV